MRSATLKVTLIIFFCALWGPVLAEEQMTHIVFRFISPDIKPNSFESTSRKIWRVGSRFIRVQEAPDPKQRIHGLLIHNAPDGWMVNLYAKSASHFVDPGPTFEVNYPIFLDSENERVKELEFGQEVSFFQKHDAHSLGSKIVDNVHTIASFLTIDDTTLTLFVRLNGKPFQVTIRDERRSYAVRYEVYETDLEPKWSLFQPPKNTKIIEVEK